MTPMICVALAVLGGDDELPLLRMLRDDPPAQTERAPAKSTLTFTESNGKSDPKDCPSCGKKLTPRLGPAASLLPRSGAPASSMPLPISRSVAEATVATTVPAAPAGAGVATVGATATATAPNAAPMTARVARPQRRPWFSFGADDPDFGHFRRRSRGR